MTGVKWFFGEWDITTRYGTVTEVEAAGVAVSECSHCAGCYIRRVVLNRGPTELSTPKASLLQCEFLGRLHNSYA